VRLFSGHSSTLAVPSSANHLPVASFSTSWTKSFKTDCCLTNLDTRLLGGLEDGLVFF
ncbi:unnamed protein product, partial [Arabidopsis halleri]